MSQHKYKVDFIKLIHELNSMSKKSLENTYKVQKSCEDNFKACDRIFKELLDTFNNSFCDGIKEYEEFNASNKVLENFIKTIKEGSIDDFLHCMVSSTFPIMTPELKFKCYSILDVDKNEKDEGVNTTLLRTPVDENKQPSENDAIIRRSSRLQGKHHKYIDMGGSKWNYETLEMELGNTQIYDDSHLYVKRTSLDKNLQDKLESLIFPNIIVIGTIALDTATIIEKVKEVSHILGITSAVIGPALANIPSEAYNELVDKIIPWKNLSDDTRDVVRRFYGWLASKDAILFIQSLCPGRVSQSHGEVIILPKPSVLWYYCLNPPLDEKEICIDISVLKQNSMKNRTIYDESHRIFPGNNGLTFNNSNEGFDDMVRRTGKSYEFRNKNIMLSQIKNMTLKDFRFYGYVNTKEICKEIRNHLSECGVTQKCFSENVLGISQGTASEILSKPKDWHSLSKRGREPYIKIRAYLDAFEEIKYDLDDIIRKEEAVEIKKLTNLHLKCKDVNETDTNLKKTRRKTIPRHLKFYPDRDDPSTLLFSELLNVSEKNTVNQNDFSLPGEDFRRIFFPLTNNSTSENEDQNKIIKYEYPKYGDEKILNLGLLKGFENNNTMGIVNNMKKVLDYYEINYENFAKNSLKIEVDYFNKLLQGPRSWMLCSAQEKKEYEKMKDVLHDYNRIAKSAYERQRKASSTNKEIMLSRNEVNTDPKPYVSFSGPVLTKELIKGNNNKNENNISLKRKCSEEENPTSPSKTRLMSVDEIVRRINASNKKRETNSIQKNGMENSHENQSTQKNPLERIPEIITIPEIVDENPPEGKMEKTLDNGTANIQSTLFNNGTPKIFQRVPNVKSNKKISFTMEQSVNKDTENASHYNALHYGNFKFNDEEKINVFNMTVKITRNDDKDTETKILINGPELELLNLAWTHNPNPDNAKTKFLAQMTVLPPETVHAWYTQFNKLKGNFLRTAVSSKKFRDTMRTNILTKTSRPEYLRIIDRLFKELFSN
uniref:CUT domain-containing protein n=1 Tax=Parastrongyloides trichosuri TaxID=131310 RepID=A0A0N5A444_PARTI